MDLLPDKDFAGVIMAAGRGARATPYSATMPKPLFNIDGITVIENTINIMKTLELKTIYIIVKQFERQIRDALEGMQTPGLKLIFVSLTEQQLDDGLRGGLSALYDAHPLDKLFVMLGDELYIDSDHVRMLQWLRAKDSCSVALMYKRSLRIAEIRKNYTLSVDEDRLLTVQEKPIDIADNLLGLGTFFFTRQFNDYIRENQGEHLVDLIGRFAATHDDVYAFESECGYVNINNRHDYQYGKYLYRQSRFDNYKVSVVIPAYNEADSIKYVVKDYLAHVHEVVVMDNVSADGTGEIARKAGAVVYSVPLKGYGDAIRQGIEQASGDIIVLTEADGTFLAKDLKNLISFLRDTDAVFGSRTHREFIGHNANMGILLRWGNKIFGNIITLLWYNRRCHFTDVGCTYRAFWKKNYDAIKDNIVGTGPELSPEIMIEFVNSYMRVIEIPINYQERCMGESKFSKSLIHNAGTALIMLRLIIMKRIKYWGSNFISLWNQQG